ncbi:DUF2339 domain-containing protein [Candidatus Woesearchaeota archaeon]|nr:DUF2339 domain-containing protein [Candidatus Woesearchaeota archaeon]
MPAKKDNWVDYFNKLDRTLNGFEQRIEKLEKQVAYISKKPTAVPVAKETKISYESPPKRRLGWGLVWLFIFLLFGRYFIGGILDFLPIPYFIISPLTWILLIAGIVLILSNPKKGTAVEKKPEEEIDLGQEALEMPQETRTSAAKKASIRAEAAKKVAPKEKGGLEASIGKKWLPKIGIISIVLGVAFFVIYAIQNKWIGPTGQVALGVLAGIIIIVVGEVFYRKEYRNYGLTLVGGGFAIIYFAMFAAYRFYGEVINISLPVDVASLSLIIIAAVYFAVRYDSKIIAAEAFFLGYVVPLLTSSVNTFFLIYAIALTAGLTILTYFKNWKLLGAGGIVAMYVTHIFWLDFYTGANKDVLHIVFLFIYFAMFAVMALNLKEDEKGQIGQFLNSKTQVGIIFVITYLFLFALDFNNFYVVMSPLLLLVILLMLFVLNYRWDYFTIGGIVLTYIVEWQWLDANLKEATLTINFVALSLYFLLFNILLFILYQEKNKVSNVIGILLNSALYYGSVIFFYKPFNRGYDGLFTASLAIFYFVLTYLAYQKKVSHYFNTSIVLCFGYLALAVPLQFNREWITISWAVLTLVLVLLSFRLKENVIRIASSAVGLITLARVLFYDTWQLKAIDLNNFINSTRLFAFAAAILIFYIIAYLYYKNKDEFEDYESYIVYVNAAYAIAATVLTTVIIWVEIWDTKLALNAKKLWTSLAFILQAIAILGFGFSAKIKLFRVMGLILFGLAILKVFLYDLSNLEMGYRIVSFIVLGIIALLGAFLYNKYKEYI